MIDVHAHILPYIDDGSKSLEESLEMAKIAVKDGIKKIINTSHYHLDSDFVRGKVLESKVLEFNKLLKEEKIDLEVLIGNELYYSRDLIKKLDELDFYSLNKSKYILLEFSPKDLPENMEDILYEFQIREYVPILAHVERYAPVLKDPNVVYEYIKNGALIQVNSTSIVGRMGKEIKKLTDILLKQDMVHFIGSDAHGAKRRKPALKESYEYVKNLIGKEKADIIFYENTKNLLEDKGIQNISPREYKEKGMIRMLKKLFQ